MSRNLLVNIIAAGLDTDTAQKALDAGLNLTKLRAATKHALDALFTAEQVERIRISLQRKVIDDQVVSELVEKCGWSCCICWKLDDRPPVIIHHITEHSKMADDSYANLVILCLNHHGIAHSRWEINRHPLPAELIRTKKLEFETALAEFKAGKRAAPGREEGGGEYQKRVLERLERLSDDLYSEFNPASELYLTGHHGLQQALSMIHATFEQHRDSILADGMWDGWIIGPSDTLRMEQILGPIRSDPFIPDQIREIVVELLEHRLEVFSEVTAELLVEYRDNLASGRITPNEANWIPLLNRINIELMKQNCAPSQIEQKVHEIRRMIQDYLRRPGGYLK